jgi:chromosome condensin MukBEF ATPase and DNA-binding subunit MukB
MTEFETNCYGMTETAIREQYMNSITAKLSGLEMVVMGMLSDSQEMLNADYFSKDDVRKQLNKAKFVLAEIMDSKRV